MSGVWAVWQTSPTQSTLLDLEDLVLAGDTTIVTNAPVDFDNTTSIELAAGVSAADLVVDLPLRADRHVRDQRRRLQHLR